MNELERNKLILLVIRWANLIVLFLFVALPICKLRFLGMEIGTGTMFDLSTSFNGEMEMPQGVAMIATLSIIAVLIGCACAFFCKRHRIGSISSTVAAVLMIVLRVIVPSVSEYGGSIKFTLVWYGALLLLILAATAYKWLPLIIDMEPEETSGEGGNTRETTEKAVGEQWNYVPQKVQETKEELPTESGMRFCRHCGNPVAPDMKFCSRCGKQL